MPGEVFVPTTSTLLAVQNTARYTPAAVSVIPWAGGGRPHSRAGIWSEASTPRFFIQVRLHIHLPGTSHYAIEAVELAERGCTESLK